MMWRLRLAVLCGLAMVAQAVAAGPRWVAGSSWQNSGGIVNWYTPNVQYFVDAGALSASVTHAQAVALVDAAAAVWNVPSVAFTLTDGGMLAEDVSSSTVYLGSSGPVWPADVQSSNYTSVQIAVVLDADGSITEMLLGGGASDPANCRQNAVTESVDLFLQPGKIAHAVLVLNGRCTGPAAEQQMQMQYQLMRAFGRVIGLGWSQTNDNVFTGNPAPTYLQQMHWPILHPIDIVCGLYTYQCMPQPFTLRDDDLAALHLVYDTGGSAPANFIFLGGGLSFPTGEGMAGGNVTVKRTYQWTGYEDPFQDISAVTGYGWLEGEGNPVSGPRAVTQDVQGTAAWYVQGSFRMFIPFLTPYDTMNLALSSEAVNPLYTGTYAVGPYREAQVTPAGSALASVQNGFYNTERDDIGWVTINDAANTCASADGTESAPAALAAGGVWWGRLCAVGHTAWSGFAVGAGRTATVEVTALDEAGLASGTKVLPVIGLWNGLDATGVLPTVASTPSALNTSHIGMTQLHVAFSSAGELRMAIADARGDGRPDYLYRARLLYADSVEPARMPAAGGAIRILGTGFALGNTVTVGGVLATVTRLSATEIDAVAPSAVALGGAAVNDVVVTDLATGGTASIVGGLTYGGASSDVVSFVLTPAASVSVGVAVPFALKVVDASGGPAASASVAVIVSGGGAVVGTCQLADCTLVTDASGVVQGTVIASTAGTVVLRASVESGASVSASFMAVQAAQAVGFVRPVEYVASGSGAVFGPAVVVAGNGVGVAGQSVVWSASSPRIVLAAVASVSGSGGLASMSATGALREGEAATVQACAWTTVCATQSVVGVAAADLRVVVTAGDAQSVSSSATLGAVSLRVVDAAGHAVAGATVTVYQAVTGWQPACAGSGRCAPAPVYGTSTTSAMSDDDGVVVVVPLQYAATAAVTTITVTAGTQGVVTATLQKTP